MAGFLALTLKLGSTTMMFPLEKSKKWHLSGFHAPCKPLRMRRIIFHRFRFAVRIISKPFSGLSVDCGLPRFTSSWPCRANFRHCFKPGGSLRKAFRRTRCLSWRKALWIGPVFGGKWEPVRFSWPKQPTNRNARLRNEPASKNFFA